MASDRLDAVGDPELRSALLYVRGREAPATADELAAHQGVHRNVARARLERLVAAGLLRTSFERRSGRAGPGAGRPAKTYRPAPELASIEFPARHHETLLALLAAALPARTRRRRLTEVGRAFGRELARAAAVAPTRSVAEAVERACAAVRSLGFQAAVESVGPERAVIVTPTCPLRPLVTADPEAAAIDRGMWAGLVDSALEDGACPGSVSCETTDCLLADGPCRVVVRFRSGG
jgi:predicted ArsR family transcriptional regulator